MSVVRPRVAAAAALALTAGFFAQGTYAAGIPANKVAASGSTTEVVHSTADTLLLSETVRINNPTDLIISASAECAIITEVTNSANGETERAFGQVKMYVTIDGVRVPVAQGDDEGGEVVFCDRAQEQTWTGDNDATELMQGDEDGDDELRQYTSTRTANAFNWLALNVGTAGDDIHVVELWADWDVQQTADAFAHAAVGNRTLILEPVKAAHGEVVELAG